jgi:hypothetical protein
MPTDTFSVATGLDDGLVGRESASAGEWPVTGSFTVLDTFTNIFVRKGQFPTFSDCAVALLRFDTSTIPDNATITAATLRLQTVAMGVLTDRDIQVGYYDPANWPIDSGDWSGADNPGSDAGVFPITDFAVGTQEDLVLSNPSSVSKTGYTGFRISISGAEPALDNPNDYRVEWAAFEHASEIEPRLLVTYTEGASVLVVPPIRRVF